MKASYPGPIPMFHAGNELTSTDSDDNTTATHMYCFQVHLGHVAVGVLSTGNHLQQLLTKSYPHCYHITMDLRINWPGGRPLHYNKTAGSLLVKIVTGFKYVLCRHYEQCGLVRARTYDYECQLHACVIMSTGIYDIIIYILGILRARIVA